MESAKERSGRVSGSQTAKPVPGDLQNYVSTRHSNHSESKVATGPKWKVGAKEAAPVQSGQGNGSKSKRERSKVRKQKNDQSYKSVSLDKSILLDKSFHKSLRLTIEGMEGSDSVSLNEQMNTLDRKLLGLGIDVGRVNESVPEPGTPQVNQSRTEPPVIETSSISVNATDGKITDVYQHQKRPMQNRYTNLCFSEGTQHESVQSAKVDCLDDRKGAGNEQSSASIHVHVDPLVSAKGQYFNGKCTPGSVLNPFPNVPANDFVIPDQKLEPTGPTDSAGESGSDQSSQDSNEPISFDALQLLESSKEDTRIHNSFGPSAGPQSDDSTEANRIGRNHLGSEDRSGRKRRREEERKEWMADTSDESSDVHTSEDNEDRYMDLNKLEISNPNKDSLERDQSSHESIGKKNLGLCVERMESIKEQLDQMNKQEKETYQAVAVSDLKEFCLRFKKRKIEREESNKDSDKKIQEEETDHPISFDSVNSYFTETKWEAGLKPNNKRLIFTKEKCILDVSIERMEEFSYFKTILVLCFNSKQIQMDGFMNFRFSKILFSDDIIKELTRKNCKSILQLLDFYGYDYNKLFLKRLYNKMIQERWLDSDKFFTSVFIKDGLHTGIFFELVYKYIHKEERFCSFFFSKPGGTFMLQFSFFNQPKCLELMVLMINHISYICPTFSDVLHFYRGFFPDSISQMETNDTDTERESGVRSSNFIIHENVPFNKTEMRKVLLSIWDRRDLFVEKEMHYGPNFKLRGVGREKEHRVRPLVRLNPWDKASDAEETEESSGEENDTDSLISGYSIVSDKMELNISSDESEEETNDESESLELDEIMNPGEERNGTNDNSMNDNSTNDIENEELRQRLSNLNIPNEFNGRVIGGTKKKMRPRLLHSIKLLPNILFNLYVKKKPEYIKKKGSSISFNFSKMEECNIDEYLKDLSLLGIMATVTENRHPNFNCFDMKMKIGIHNHVLSDLRYYISKEERIDMFFPVCLHTPTYFGFAIFQNLRAHLSQFKKALRPTTDRLDPLTGTNTGTGYEQLYADRHFRRTTIGTEQVAKLNIDRIRIRDCCYHIRVRMYPLQSLFLYLLCHALFLCPNLELVEFISGNLKREIKEWMVVWLLPNVIYKCIHKLFYPIKLKNIFTEVNSCYDPFFTASYFRSSEMDKVLMFTKTYNTLEKDLCPFLFCYLWLIKSTKYKLGEFISFKINEFLFTFPYANFLITKFIHNFVLFIQLFNTCLNTDHAYLCKSHIYISLNQNVSLLRESILSVLFSSPFQLKHA